MEFFRMIKHKDVQLGGTLPTVSRPSRVGTPESLGKSSEDKVKDRLRELEGDLRGQDGKGQDRFQVEIEYLTCGSSDWTPEEQARFARRISGYATREAIERSRQYDFVQPEVASGLRLSARKSFEYGVSLTKELTNSAIDPEWIVQVRRGILNGKIPDDILVLFVNDPPLAPIEQEAAGGL